MQTDQRSATAYDKLARLTDEYTGLQAVVHSWRVFSRSVRGLMETYALDFPDDTETIDLLKRSEETALTRRQALHVQLQGLSNEMDTLNHLIQNGAFNDEIR